MLTPCCSFVLNFYILFVHCQRRFATSVPVERSSPICQGTKVSIRIFFPYFPSPSILKSRNCQCRCRFFSKTDSVSNGENVSKPNLSADSVSNCISPTKNESLSNMLLLAYCIQTIWFFWWHKYFIKRYLSFHSNLKANFL